MADGFKGAAQLIGEAVVKPVVDEVGKMVETGVQTATGINPNPNLNKKTHNQNLPDPQKLAADDNRKKRNIMQFLQNYKQDNQKFIQQKQAQDQHKQQGEVQQKHEVQQFEFAKKQHSTQRDAELQRAKTRSERKSGVGG